jgi:hypothetical protein
MSAIPAVRSSCGLQFGSPLPLGGPGFVSRDNSTTCPRCGGEAHIADLEVDESGRVRLTSDPRLRSPDYFREVTSDFLNSAFGLLTRPDVTVEHLRALAAILETEQKRGSTPSEVATAVNAAGPALSRFTDRLIPRNPGEFWTMMAALIALVSILIQCADTDSKLEQTVIINHVVNQTITNAFGAPDTPSVHHEE